MSTQSFFRILFASWCLCLLISVGIYFSLGALKGQSYFFGSMVSLINTAIFASLWRAHFEKKDVAQFAIVIVIKYAILMLIIYYTLVLGNLSLEAAGIGLVSTMIVISIVTAKKMAAENIKLSDEETDKNPEQNTDGSPL